MCRGKPYFDIGRWAPRSERGKRFLERTEVEMKGDGGGYILCFGRHPLPIFAHCPVTQAKVLISGKSRRTNVSSSLSYSTIDSRWLV